MSKDSGITFSFGDIAFIGVLMLLALAMMTSTLGPLNEKRDRAIRNKNVSVTENVEYKDVDGETVNLLDINNIFEDSRGKVKVMMKDGTEIVLNEETNYKTYKEYFEKLEDGKLVQIDGLKDWHCK